MKVEILSKLKGKDKIETAENYSILFIFIGALAFSSGVGLSIISTKGFSAILAMFGGLISFLSTIALIITWIVKEFTGK